MTEQHDCIIFQTVAQIFSSQRWTPFRQTSFRQVLVDWFKNHKMFKRIQNTQQRLGTFPPPRSHCPELVKYLLSLTAHRGPVPSLPFPMSRLSFEMLIAFPEPSHYTLSKWYAAASVKSSHLSSECEKRSMQVYPDPQFGIEMNGNALDNCHPTIAYPPFVLDFMW